jgi:hypothetical protein
VFDEFGLDHFGVRDLAARAVRLDIDARRQPAAVVELNAAKAAVVELAVRQFLEEIQRAGEHLIDFVEAFQFGDAVCPALRTARMFTQMIGVASWNGLLVLARGALIYRQVPKSFQEPPMHAS